MYKKIISAVACCPGKCIVSMALSINKDKNRTKAITGGPQLTTLQYSPGHRWVN